ncbi:TM2 domain-containing protein [Noviherbaspirillum saxi]|uniref:TM2 domain-containing protein n=1 Tax=Noviherbaspirillum saxi TaxID=2320863 RepID=A0A3A3FT71_9BURK|nr:TM2 domain-containing protein [Noviherbaspirillum saxi]RJF99246.1 TM2 domain-containing protein [Noviherbaspirillum saxi]
MCNALPVMNQHKNKTLATFLATFFGSFGAHRFYLHGKKDKWAWLHLVLFPLSIFAGFIGALIIGLTPDEKWDAQHNANSGRQSNSGWLVIILVVLTFAGGATALIAAIARTFDLLFTGGAYG